MFDVQIGENIFTICDMCNKALFDKTLKAECHKNGRVKSKEDMEIIYERRRAQSKERERLEKAIKGET